MAKWHVVAHGDEFDVEAGYVQVTASGVLEFYDTVGGDAATVAMFAKDDWRRFYLPEKTRSAD